MSKQTPGHSLKAICAVLNAARILRRLGLIMILLLITAVSLAGCRATVTATPEASPIIVTLTAEVPATATVQAPQAETISVNGAAPTESAPAWTPPTGNEFITPSDEITPESITPFDRILKNGLAKYGITLDHTEYHSNGQTGDNFQWSMTGVDQQGNVVWAVIPAGKQRQKEYPIYFNPVMDNSGKTIDYEVTNVVNGKKITYKAVPDSQDADVIFAAGDKIPTLVKDSVTTPDGRQVFLKYFDRTTNEWVPNPNINVTDADGKPMSWNGKEWETTITSCVEVEPTTDLSPGSELAKSLDTKTGTGFSRNVSLPPEIDDYLVLFGKGGFLENVKEIPLHTKGFTGTAICLFIIARDSSGYVRIPVLGGIKTADSFGYPIILGDIQEKTFPINRKRVSFMDFGRPETYAELLKYYKSITGKRVGFNFYAWKEDHPFDPDAFATVFFRQITYDTTAVPGHSSIPSANTLYEFVKAACSSPESCYAQNPIPGQSYGDMKVLRERGISTPYGIIIVIINDVAD